MHEECGVFGIYAPDGKFDPAEVCYIGLFALQHRGQESAGIAVADEKGFRCHKDMGLCSEVFKDGLSQLSGGKIGIGHVRYSTAGESQVINSQPIVIAKDVPYETVIEIETKSMTLSGMEIAVGTKRVYPRSTLAAQVIGYMGAIPSADKWSVLQKKGYKYSDTIGVDGIEASMEDWLTQNSDLRQGYRVVERDRVGKITRELSYTEPQDGNNVKLTIVASYQQQAERALERARSTPGFSQRVLIPAYALAAASFCLLFGGDAATFGVTFAIGVIVQAVQPWFAHIQMGVLLGNFVGGWLTAVLAQMLQIALPVYNVNAAIIGGIMPLLSGLAMTTAVRDTVYGDLVSGMTRALEAMLLATAVAIGVYTGLKMAAMMGGIVL